MPQPQRPISLLLVEDHAIVREGTRQLLEREPGIHVVGEAADGQQAIELALSLRPDVVLLDLDLPITSGVGVTRAIRSAEPAARVLILTAYADAGYVSAAMEAGASGYLLKSASGPEVVAAIVAVSRDGIVLHPSVMRHALADDGDDDQLQALSGREMQVIGRAARGERTREIASAMGLSPRTVEAHLTSIYNKLGATSRTEAVFRAASLGLIYDDPSAGARERVVAPATSSCQGHETSG